MARGARSKRVKANGAERPKVPTHGVGALAPYPRQLTVEPRKQTLLRRFERVLGRDHITVALQQLHGNAKVEKLVALLVDPTFRDCTLANLVGRAEMTLSELQRAFRSVKLDEALIRLYKHFPDVAEDVAKDARSTRVACPRCDGSKVVGVGKKQRACPRCKGKGEIRAIGDEASRKLLFETAGLTGRRGPLIAQQFNLGGESLEDTVMDATAALSRGTVEQEEL